MTKPKHAIESAALPEGLLRGADGRVRCWWAGNDPLYQQYHDQEWGRPVSDDRALFEKLCLEGFQAGLSWITILKRRENFRRAFYNFDAARVAEMNEQDIKRLLEDPGIIRHRGKIEAAINNARALPDLVAEYGSLSAYIWSFKPQHESSQSQADYASLRTKSQTPESQDLSRDLKKRGFRFVGATTLYALMQACGLVNDHIHGCVCRQATADVQEKFVLPAGAAHKRQH